MVFVQTGNKSDQGKKIMLFLARYTADQEPKWPWARDCRFSQFSKPTLFPGSLYPVAEERDPGNEVVPLA